MELPKRVTYLSMRGARPGCDRAGIIFFACVPYLYREKCQDKDGNDMVAVSFGTLTLMHSWCERYGKYMEDVEKCNSIKDVKKRAEVLKGRGRL